MFSKTSAGLTAGLVIVFAYLLPLALPLAAARFLPGVELSSSPTSPLGWIGLLLATGFLLWVAEMAGKWTHLQVSVFNSNRELAASLGAVVELALTTCVFGWLLTSWPIAALCALVLFASSAVLEKIFPSNRPL